MNDYIDYMNALSATTATNEQAQNAYQSIVNYKDQIVQAKDDYKQQFAIIPELITGASGEYILKGLGTKAISLLSDTAKSAAKSAIKTGLKNAGIDEEIAEATANDVLSGNVGNIANRITSGAQDIVGEAEGGLSSALESATSLARGVVSGAVENISNIADTGIEGAISGVQSVAGDIVSQGTSLATNFYANTIANTSFPTLGSVQARTGFPLEEWSDDWGAASRLEAQTFPSITAPTPTLPSSVEMVDMASIEPSTTAEVATTATAEAGADVGAEVATDVGVTAGLEAVGAGLDATGVLAPIGAIVGLIGGLAGFFGLEKRDPLPPPPPLPAFLNPSQSFGT